MPWWSRSVVCREAVELVTDYLEGTLAARARRRFEAHLADCPACTEYLEQMRRMIDTLGRIEPESLDEGRRGALVELYREWSAG